jgi:hypothetical protein
LAPTTLPTTPLKPDIKELLTEVNANRVHTGYPTRQERARALFAGYGLTLEDHEWITSRSEPVERVEKRIRMRVRRQCHRCQTTFGADRICSNCHHTRCRKCPRYPPKKSKPETEVRPPGAPDDGGGGGLGIGIADRVERRDRLGTKLVVPSRTGQYLIHKSIIQRVRRTCHICGTMFVRDATECLLCHHTRCKDCPREP